MTDEPNPQSAPGKGFRIGLWVAQLTLAFLFGFAGATKLSTPIPELVATMVWPGAVPPLLVRFIGFAELIGAVGLTLPSITRILPKLTPLAAAGLVTVMALASVFHLSRGEYLQIGANAVLGSLALFVAWGRYRKAPIASRG